eukprot:m.378136 g.378136  ORF g.378136 m.378136 type:complete len:119 (-) comp28212_c0_seq1:184-540(-)
MDWISNWTPRSIVMLAAETVGGTSQNVVVFPSTACEAGCAGSWALATAVAVWITTFGSTGGNAAPTPPPPLFTNVMQLTTPNVTTLHHRSHPRLILSHGGPLPLSGCASCYQLEGRLR